MPYVIGIDKVLCLNVSFSSKGEGKKEASTQSGRLIQL